MAKYQEHKNWNHWNVSLWINNDEGLYNLAKTCIERYPTKDRAAKNMFEMLQILYDDLEVKTPDGAPYSVTSIRAAMVGM